MRRYFLSYNALIKVYNLDPGCFNSKDRIVIQDEVNLSGYVRKIIGKKGVVYVDKDINESIKQNLEKSFRDTKVNIQFKKDLSSLC